MKTNFLITTVLAAVLLMGWAGESKAVSDSEHVITFTTVKAVGETVTLHINAEEADRSGVWIDLNNNGVKDAGEAVTIFGDDSGTEFTLGAQTISIYGKVTELRCDENRIIEMDLSKNPELTKLGCGFNQLTALDVSNNRKLSTLICSRNQLTALDVSNNPELTMLHCDENQLAALNLLKKYETD